ncbi:hypothetical protein SNE40_015879 [Patella caerulea]
MKTYPQINENQKLNSESFLVISPLQVLQCARECQLRSVCSSFNYDTQTHECFLNTESSGDQSQTQGFGGEARSGLEAKTGFLHSDIQSWPKNLAEGCMNHECPVNTFCESDLNIGVTCVEESWTMVTVKEDGATTSQADTTTSQADTLTEQADTTSQADTTTSQADTLTDQADTTTSQADTTMGQADTTTSQADTTMGQADTTTEGKFRLETIVVNGVTVTKLELTSTLTSAEVEKLIITHSACLQSCTDVPGGDYQYCGKCTTYITCSNGALYERPCAGGLQWDQTARNCVFSSSTCSY